MKPLLARGTLQCAGATTFDEYRKSIEKDAALARRFQPVIVTEPSVEATISILRGLKSRYEVHHGVAISDAALVTAATYSARYLSERKNPDASIDLIDEAASALRLQQESKPEAIETLDRQIMTMQIEIESLRQEKDVFSSERREALERQLEAKRKENEELTKAWMAERAKLDEIKDLKARLEEAKMELEHATREGNFQRASELRYGVIPDLERRLPKEGAIEVEAGGLIHERVTPDDIAIVVSRMTGIPAKNLLRGERERLLHVEDKMRERIVGQDHVLGAIGEAVRLSRAGLQSSKRPLASFLFLGSTGTGKTETCKALANFLFDSDNAIIQLNMSEYSEQHSVSKLVGAPAGYVGFEEGGMLTESVRRKPYCVIRECR